MRLTILTCLNRNIFSKTSLRNLSYVEKCKYLKEVKENGEECLCLLPQGKFLVYKGSKPFLESIRVSSGKNAIQQNLKWFSYSELLDYRTALVSSFVLVGVGEDKTVRFGVKLGQLTEEAELEFENIHGGTFMELRAALFLVSWRDAHILSRANSLLLFHQNCKFCGRCGNQTQRNAHGDSRWCPKCKATFYPHLHPVGIVLVTDPPRDHALLVRQHRHPQGMFTCIAGYADVGESLEETVKREVAEEVGLEVGQVEYVASQHWPFPGSLMAGCYAVAPCKEELVLDSSELDSGRWFTRAEIGEAIERTGTHPFGALGTSPSKIFIPPRGAIAYHLIYHWFKGTSLKDIEKQIK